MALRLLGQGLTIEETTARLIGKTGCDFDVLSFVRDLVELGFVAEIDCRPVQSEPPSPPSFPRLRPEHLRFVLSPVLPALFGCLMLAAGTTLVIRPELLPGYQDLLWSSHGSLVLALSAIGGWSLLFTHEMAHLVTARATGVQARIRLGTRLQFLVAETDISGIELAPRRHRLTAYLAGMAVNLSTAALAILLLAVTEENAVAHRILSAVVVLAVVPLSFQLLVFMRTDAYFVMQDLLGCRDLFGDGKAYAKYIRGRAWKVATGRGPALADPSLSLPPHERHAVRMYSIVLVMGTILCLAALTAFTLPADIALISQAVTRLGPHHPAMVNVDSVVVLLVLGTAHILWAVTWWRQRNEMPSPSKRSIPTTQRTF